MVDLEKSILTELPQIPYVIDQVGEAFAWLKEDLEEGEYNRVLEQAWEVTNYAKSISDPNFFKIHLILGSMISEIPNALSNPKFAKFDTASKATENTVKKLIVDSKEVEKYGNIKALLLKLIPLAKEDESCFAVSLISIKQHLKEILKGMKPVGVKTPITSEDYVVVLGYALIMANIRMANIKMLDSTYQIFNNIEILLNTEFNY
jgi:hypothetical protein